MGCVLVFDRSSEFGAQNSRGGWVNGARGGGEVITSLCALRRPRPSEPRYPLSSTICQSCTKVQTSRRVPHTCCPRHGLFGSGPQAPPGSPLTRHQCSRGTGLRGCALSGPTSFRWRVHAQAGPCSQGIGLSPGSRVGLEAGRLVALRVLCQRARGPCARPPR